MFELLLGMSGGMGTYQTPRYTGRAVVVDVETTGLDSIHDEVVEFAAVLFSFDYSDRDIVHIIDEYQEFNQPQRPIPVAARAVHGITDKMVHGHRLDQTRMKAIFDQAEFVVSHNARFDYPFVSRIYPPAAQRHWLCSMTQIDWYRHGFASRGLQFLAHAHHLDVPLAHRAKADCLTTLALLTCRSMYMKELLQRLLDTGLTRAT